jgi:hypothetical protein
MVAEACCVVELLEVEELVLVHSKLSVTDKLAEKGPSKPAVVVKLHE